MKDKESMDTKSINTISNLTIGITGIRTHPQKNITTIGITGIRTHPQKNITTIGITEIRIHPQKSITTTGIIKIRNHPQKNITTTGIINPRNHPPKSITKGLEIIKNMLKAEITGNKIPGTPTVTEQKEKMRNVSHKRDKAGQSGSKSESPGINRQDPVKALALPGSAYLSRYFRRPETMKIMLSISLLQRFKSRQHN